MRDAMTTVLVLCLSVLKPYWVFQIFVHKENNGLPLVF